MAREITLGAKPRVTLRQRKSSSLVTNKAAWDRARSQITGATEADQAHMTGIGNPIREQGQQRFRKIFVQQQVDAHAAADDRVIR